jgi:hypothetical protein
MNKVQQCASGGSRYKLSAQYKQLLYIAAAAAAAAELSNVVCFRERVCVCG